MGRFRGGNTVLVPLAAAASSPAELPAGYRPLYLPVSNGLGAGLSRAAALTHALLELLQRDGNSVSYRALDQGRVLDLAGVANPASRALLVRLRALGLELRVKLATTDFGLVNLHVVGAQPGDEQPAGMAAACGEACSPDREVALEKALLAFAAARTRLAFNHGPLEGVGRVAPPGYLEAYRAAFAGSAEEPRALSEMQGWLELSPQALRRQLEPVFSEATRVLWSDLPSTVPGDLLTDLSGRLGEFDLLYLDLASERAQAAGSTSSRRWSRASRWRR